LFQASLACASADDGESIGDPKCPQNYMANDKPSLKLANWLSMNVKQRGKTKLQFPGFIDSRNSVFG
jgi:hypothetical protein